MNKSEKERLLKLATSKDLFQEKINLICGVEDEPELSPRSINHVNDILTLLNSFPDCAGYSGNRRGRIILSLDDEGGVQDMMYFMLKPSIPDLVPEQPVSGPMRQYSIADFRSKELRTVIEAKRTRNKQHGKSLRAELHDDIGEYKNDPYCDDLIFFIYDPETFIESPSGLISAIEGEHAHNGNSLRVHCCIHR